MTTTTKKYCWHPPLLPPYHVHGSPAREPGRPEEHACSADSPKAQPKVESQADAQHAKRHGNGSCDTDLSEVGARRERASDGSTCSASTAAAQHELADSAHDGQEQNSVAHCSTPQLSTDAALDNNRTRFRLAMDKLDARMNRDTLRRRLLVQHAGYLGRLCSSAQAGSASVSLVASARMGSLKSVQQLKLRVVRDRGPHVASSLMLFLMLLPNLRHLDLSGSFLSREEVLALQMFALNDLTRVTYLDLAGCHIAAGPAVRIRTKRTSHRRGLLNKKRQARQPPIQPMRVQLGALRAR